MAKPLLCVTVSAPTMADLRRQRDEASRADLVELRLDLVSDPDVAGALADRRCRVVVTCRPTWEGGGFRGSEEERKRILVDALALGAEYIDLEWRAGWNDLIQGPRGEATVVSFHDFDGMPGDAASCVAAMRATGASIVKLAVKTRCLSDCVSLLELGAEAGRDGRLVLIGMGEHGLATRVLAGRFGSAWTYAGNIPAIGQVSARSMVEEYRFPEITDATAVYGVVGRSVAHSVSPAMHNAAFRSQQIDAVYLPLPAVGADDFVRFGRAIGLSGASVTIPHKVALFDRLDEVDAVARRIGAVNTIRNEGGRWIGGNTDASGFLQPLHRRVALAGMRASILGAGGAARAVAEALASSGCDVRIHARMRTKAEAVAMLTSADVGPWPPEPGSWDLLVNCTPIGQFPHTGDSPVPMGDLSGDCVYDLVYNPTTTKLMRDAMEMGCDVIGGLEMLVAQAQEQFTWWTGVQAPADIMRQAALARLAEFSRDENHVV